MHAKRLRRLAPVPLKTVLLACAVLAVHACSLPPPRIPGKQEPAPPPPIGQADDSCDQRPTRAGRDACRDMVEHPRRR